MRQDRAVHPDDVVALMHHDAPPVVLQVALQFDAERSVIPGAVKSAVDFAGLKMKPRRLHRLTIFSMRCVSVGVFIIFATDEHRLTRIQTRELQWREMRRLLAESVESGQREVIPPSGFIRVNLWLTLRFDFHLGLHRVGDKALLVCAMIHFLDFLRRGLFLAGEFQALSKCDACNGESPFGIFIHVANGIVNIFVEHELFFARDREEREHVTARKRCHEGLLRIDQVRITEILGRG